MTTKMGWIDYGTYWVNTEPQGSDAWKRLRNRPTASKFGCIAGRSRFSTPEKTARVMVGLDKEDFTEEAIARMNRGTLNEPIARDWYCRTRNVQVEEVGLAVPKWDVMIGASLDGDVKLPNGQSGDGMIEIKCPDRMYGPLDDYTEQLREGWQPPPGYHDHIWSSHYDQMQGCMAITKKRWCDYIVYCPNESRVFVERILFNEDHWLGVLYPALQRFNQNLLLPLLRETGQDVEIPPVAHRGPG
jgi:hypothetical protein